VFIYYERLYYYTKTCAQIVNTRYLRARGTYVTNSYRNNNNNNNRRLRSQVVILASPDPHCTLQHPLTLRPPPTRHPLTLHPPRTASSTQRKRPTHLRCQEPTRVRRRKRFRQGLLRPFGSRRFHPHCWIHRRRRPQRFQRRRQERRWTQKGPS